MRILILLCFAAACLSACSFGEKNKTSDKEETESSADNSDSPADAVRKAMEGLTGARGDGKAVEPVNHRELKALLKDRLNGFSQGDISSESVGAMGFNISNATADYRDGDKKINVTLADSGGFGAVMMSLAAWSSLHIDKEDKNGWERTSTWKGYKSYEKYDKSNNYGQFMLIIENRFVVSLEGNNTDMDDLKDFAADMDLGDLKKLM